MKFFSPKPKKFLIFKERFLKVLRIKLKILLKLVSYVFSIFTTVKYREIRRLKHITSLCSKELLSYIY